MLACTCKPASRAPDAPVKKPCARVRPVASLQLARETTCTTEAYTLPDGRTIRVGAERFTAPEALINPRWGPGRGAAVGGCRAACAAAKALAHLRRQALPCTCPLLLDAACWVWRRPAWLKWCTTAYRHAGRARVCTERPGDERSPLRPGRCAAARAAPQLSPSNQLAVLLQGSDIDNRLPLYSNIVLRWAATPRCTLLPRRRPTGCLALAAPSPVPTPMPRLCPRCPANPCAPALVPAAAAAQCTRVSPRAWKRSCGRCTWTGEEGWRSANLLEAKGCGCLMLLLATAARQPQLVEPPLRLPAALPQAGSSRATARACAGSSCGWRTRPGGGTWCGKRGWGAAHGSGCSGRCGAPAAPPPLLAPPRPLPQVFTGAAVLADIMREQPEFWVRWAQGGGRRGVGAACACPACAERLWICCHGAAPPAQPLCLPLHPLQQGRVAGRPAPRAEEVRRPGRGRLSAAAGPTLAACAFVLL